MPLDRSTADALVAMWCCRLWQYNAEHEASLQSGVESSRSSIGIQAISDPISAANVL
ncbi:hypothetical protein IMZ48_45795 [Candidatus Bathyarchaeota archaeon]|nr:hypothetical protein [Candidatus Bathyarchaeota archaeon]